MKNKFFGLSALLFFFTAVAYADSSVRQNTDETITINAPAEKVWGIIKNYGGMSWLPPVKSTYIKGGNEKGAIRVLTLQDGNTITEELKDYDNKKMSYSYKITAMSSVKTITHDGAEQKVPVVPVSDYSATIGLNAQGATTLVRWHADYYRAYTDKKPPEEMNEAAANAAIKGIFTSGLANLKTLAEK